MIQGIARGGVVAVIGGLVVYGLTAAAANAAEAATAMRPGLPSLAELGLQEGAEVSSANAEQYEKLLTPGLRWGVEQGWRLRVVEPTHIPMPRRYREATEKYAGQVRLADGGLRLENYVAGLPFPEIDPNDPKAAYKLMWNFYYNWSPTDDVTERAVDTNIGAVPPNRAMDVERHLLLDAYRKLYYNGRLYVPPHPELPNPQGVRFKESLHPMLEPFDIKGMGATFYRYLDPNKQDDSWVYLPQLRRVRRLSTAQRSDALFGQDVDADMFWGYNGHIAWMDYRLIGERTVLMTMHARHVPARWQSPEDWLWDDVWEPRPVWVVEARSKLDQYAFGKRVLYIDKEAWVIPISDSYDRAGQLWKVWVAMWSFKKTGFPDGRGVQYEDPVGFEHATVVMDVQLSHATSSSLPSPNWRDGEGFYINQGAKQGVTEEYFTIGHLIESGS